MASVNKVILIGNLGRDPEARYMPDGGAVTNFSMATTEKWKDKNGDAQEKTEWHRVAFFGKTAEVAAEYLKKGHACYVEGKLQTRKWTDKDGVEKYTTEVVGERLQFLERKPEGGGSGAAYRSAKDGTSKPNATPARDAASKFDDFEDDIPF